MGVDLNSLSFIHNYLKFVVPQLSGMTWKRTQVASVWIGPANFDDTRSDDLLLEAAQREFAREKGWRDFIVKDVGKINILYFLGSHQQRSTILNRAILGEVNGVEEGEEEEEVEFIFDFLPFHRTVKAVKVAENFSDATCADTYEDYKSSLSMHAVENFQTVGRNTQHFIFI